MSIWRCAVVGGAIDVCGVDVVMCCTGEMAGCGGGIIDLVCGAVIVQVSGGGLWKHAGGDAR